LDQKTLLVDRMAERGIVDNIFAEGFKSVTDIKIGPDGFIYVVSFYDGAYTRYLVITLATKILS
jgi:hypothetical protein